jgi:hypothetical protein
MNTTIATIATTGKKPYNTPRIERIKLDNEISLALESTQPSGEPNNWSKAPEYFNNDPFKTNVG